MATLSEANYSLILDFPVSEESTVIEKEPTVTDQNQSHNEYTFILYQKRHSTRNEEEIEISEEEKQQDETKMSQEPLEEFDVNLGPSSFQITMFLRSFFLYILWMSGIGLVLFPLLWYCGPKFFRNHFRYTDQEIPVIFGIGGLIYLLISLQNHKSVDTNFQRLYHCHMIFVCSFASAVFQANLPKKLMDLLKNIDLRSFEPSRFRIDNWAKILAREDPEGNQESYRLKHLKAKLRKKGTTEEEIEKRIESKKDNISQEKLVDNEFAIQSTISRLNIDISLFYLTFFQKTPQNLLRSVMGFDEFSFEEKQNKIIWYSKAPKSKLLTSISRFEYDLFLHRFFTNPNKYDNEKAHVYPLAYDIFRRLDNPKQGRIYIYFYFCIIYAGSLLFSIDNLRGGGALQLSLTLISSTISCMIPYVCLSFFLYKAVNLMKSKDTYMKELEELMSTESKFEEEKEKKYPNLNILDFMSIKSWACLRKIFMHLNDEKEQATIRAISSVLVIQFFTLIVVALYYLKILGSPETKVSKPLIIFALNALAFLVTFFVVIYYAAKVNSQFEIHRNIIRANKQIADTLFQLYPDCVGDNAIVPGTYIYNVGLNSLKKEFGEDLSPEVKKKMKEKYNTLMRTYDNVLEELDYEEIHYPVKILGLAITKTVVQSFGAVLISISTPLIKQGFTYISSLAKNE